MMYQLVLIDKFKYIHALLVRFSDCNKEANT